MAYKRMQANLNNVKKTEPNLNVKTCKNCGYESANNMCPMCGSKTVAKKAKK